jgi:hypothetical protein
MRPEDMLRRQRAASREWLELDDEPRRRAVYVRRPHLVEGLGFHDSDGKVKLALVNQRLRDLVVDWRGFTEADLLGSSIGSDALQDFDADVFAEWAGDQPELVMKIAMHAIELWARYNKQRDGDAKNSSPSSTTEPA